MTPFRISTASETISFECPPQLRERLLTSDYDRREFILQAIVEKLDRDWRAGWKPTTIPGLRLAELSEAGKAERSPLLSEEEFERALSQRRDGR
ncbi:hypothetical protein LBMAG56_36340 [Verrucomicrobiota bacterium]|nr:hypothetical protein LBMAG56_36340 [Verrucomicrobiota bacterium]